MQKSSTRQRMFLLITTLKTFLPASLFLSCLLFCQQPVARAASNITLTSVAVPSASVNQGSATNVVYIVKLTVATAPVTVNMIHVPFGGTQDANDLTIVQVYFNATAPAISGATLLNNINATFAAPHTYDIALSKAMAAATSGYFIITASINSTASDGKTIKIKGSTGPVVFGFTTAQTITNSQTDVAGTVTIQAADITLISNTVASANVNQGSATNVVYIVKMNVATEPVTVNMIHVPFGGTQDANDLTIVQVYFNATAPAISGATLLNNINATFAAPHTYDIAISKAMAAGTSGYFIITASINSTASDGKTIKIKGSTAPVVFGFTTAPNITNSQTDVAGTVTIQAADITLTSNTVALANVNQGSATNVVYIVKMNVATEPVTVNMIHVPFGGTHDANDLTIVQVYFNATAPAISGATLLNNINATFAAPHTYDIAISKAMAAGTSGYFIITASINSTASDGKTIKIKGSTAPVVFGFTTAPNITNSQTDVAGTVTIQAADITLISNTVALANVNQGSATNVVYIVKMNVATEPVTVNMIHVPFGGTHDANDLTIVQVYFNATAPAISGATLLNNINATFAAPHTYDIAISKAMAAGTSGYFIITASINSTASDGKTIKIKGSTAPVVFGFTTAPNITNSQTDVAGTVTIQAADITLISNTVASANVNQGSATNVVYIVKMNVATEPVTVNMIHVPFGGTHDANDLTIVQVYFNATAPAISGATLLNNINATFAAPHTYDIAISKAMAAGTSGYFIITASINSAASDGKTIKIKGSTAPVVFGFTTAPNITNSQTDVAGTVTIQAADITLISNTVASANVNQGSATNVVYIVKMNVATEPVTVNMIHVPFGGTHDANDLTIVQVYFNATAPAISGATLLNNINATFAAPHTYDIAISKAMAAGTSGYFIITANINSTASAGKTIKINGATGPAVFGFITAPNITNNQTDVAGTITIHQAPAFSYSPVKPEISTDAIAVTRQTAKEIFNTPFKIQGSVSSKELSVNTVYPNPARDILTYTIFSSEGRKLALYLFDITGKVLINKMITITKGTYQGELNISQFQSGNYRVNITDPATATSINKPVTIAH